MGNVVEALGPVGLVVAGGVALEAVVPLGGIAGVGGLHLGAVACLSPGGDLVRHDGAAVATGAALHTYVGAGGGGDGAGALRPLLVLGGDLDPVLAGLIGQETGVLALGPFQGCLGVGGTAHELPLPGDDLNLVGVCLFPLKVDVRPQGDVAEAAGDDLVVVVIAVASVEGDGDTLVGVDLAFGGIDGPHQAVGEGGLRSLGGARRALDHQDRGQGYQPRGRH